MWICHDCGEYLGSRKESLAVCKDVATFHKGTCEICGKTDFVTEARDYGITEKQVQAIRETPRCT